MRETPAEAQADREREGSKGPVPDERRRESSAGMEPSRRGAAEDRAMDELKVVRLDETEVVKFGPDAIYQLILGDDEGTTPIRTGIQTSRPGYVAPVHSHPYMEVLHILDGVAEAWVDGREDRKITLRRGDTIAIPPEVPHSFRVVGDEVLRLLGTHASPKRIVNYKDGVKSDARGYRILAADSSI
jgi:mannose-6-phosphate isomerase-like protein (cupin superfamily)